MRPPSRVRLCSVFKEPVPSSGGFPVSREFPFLSRAFSFGPPRGWPRRRSALDCLRDLLAGKIGPGHRRGRWKIRKARRDVKRIFQVNRRKMRRGPPSGFPCEGGVPCEGDLATRPRRSRSKGNDTRRSENDPLSLSGTRGSTAAHSVLFSARKGKGGPEGAAIPPKWDFLEKAGLRRRTERDSGEGAERQRGNVRRRPTTVHPPARSRASVDG